MAVAVAEQIRQPQLEEYFEDKVPPQLVEVVPEMAEDVLTRLRAARFIGACMVGEQIDNVGIEANLTVQPIESLYDAIQMAAEGDIGARKMVETNTRTDVIERTIKTGHVIKVDLHVDESGKIQQYGQSMESVQANSLRFAADVWQMRQRTEAEATNAFRIEQHHKEGKLQDYSLVVFSRAADNMTKKDMEDAGFFTDTMSCAIQVTTAQGDRLTTESAFVSGIKRPGEERHDAYTVVATAAALGVDLQNKSAAETIDTPLLIHNSLIPNGVIDLVKLYDDCAGGTFFGETRRKEDYLDYRDKCEEREQTLQPKVDAIVQELISEAPKIRDRVEAVKRLHKLSEKHMVEQAAFDNTINPHVFGPVAAAHIEQARMQFELGNNGAGLDSIYQAKQTAVSSSCPSALKSSSLSQESSSEDSSSNDKTDDSGECDFISKECPKCGAKNVKTHVTKTRISGSCGCSVKK